MRCGSRSSGKGEKPCRSRRNASEGGRAVEPAGGDLRGTGGGRLLSGEKKPKRDSRAASPTTAIPAFSLYLRRSFAKSMGYSSEMLGRPVVGIADSNSGFNNCHRHFPELIEAVKRGVLAAGGLPIEFPDRVARRGVPQPDLDDVPQPDVDRRRGDDPRAADGRGGAGRRLRQDRAGAAHGRGLGRSCPAVQLLAGPMMPTSFHGERLGACTDCRRFWAMHRAGKVDAAEIETIEGNLATTAGTCAVMGTASHHGLDRRGARHGAAGQRGDSGGARRPPARRRGERRAGGGAGHGHRSGRSQVITEKSVENALRVLLAIGGSTNAIVHLTAIAGRAGVEISLQAS